MGWHDLGLLVVFYVLAVLGVTVGLHRHFTHQSFKARPWLRVAMAIAGSLAVQGNVLNWVADHRRHHAFSDREGDHSPWLHGTSPLAVESSRDPDCVCRGRCRSPSDRSGRDH